MTDKRDKSFLLSTIEYALRTERKSYSQYEEIYSGTQALFLVRCCLLATNKLKLTEEMVKKTLPTDRADLAYNALIGKIRRTE